MSVIYPLAVRANTTASANRPALTRRSLIAAFRYLTTVQDTACRYTLTAELGQVRGSVVTVFG